MKDYHLFLADLQHLDCIKVSSFCQEPSSKCLGLCRVQEHKQNMEPMASKVCKCIGNAVYNEEPIQCFPGIGAEDKFVFNNASSLKLFSLLSVERRREDETTYEPVRNDILEYLENVWHVEKNFKGCYSKDYRTFTSSKTACTDKYSVSIFQENEDWKSAKPLERFDHKPLPDYKRWRDQGASLPQLWGKTWNSKGTLGWVSWIISSRKNTGICFPCLTFSSGRRIEGNSPSSLDPCQRCITVFMPKRKNN